MNNTMKAMFAIAMEEAAKGKNPGDDKQGVDESEWD
jgi:hypothetical protein